MNPDAEIQKFSQLVLADTSVKNAVDKKLAVEMNLLVPQMQLRGSKVQTVGGFMGVPLREMRLGQGQAPFLIDDFLGSEAVKRGEEVILVLDTGSQGFWVMDMTQGKDGVSLLQKATLGSFTGDYELVLGNRGSKDLFTIKIPQQWRDFEGGSELLKKAPYPTPNQGPQCLIVGNPFLQAISMTFSPTSSPAKAYFSHLDADGRRCASFQGPQTILSKQQSASLLATSSRPARTNKLHLKDGRLHAPTLVDASLSMSAPPHASSRKATDVTLDLRFMKLLYNSSHGRGGAQAISMESRSAQDLVIPCLDVLITDAQGNQVYCTHIFDTGSGVNLGLDVDLDPTMTCPDGACYCHESGKVGEVFSKNLTAGKNAELCSKCVDPASEAKSSEGGCNAKCCTPEGVQCEDEMPCSVMFCTGVVSYTPHFARMSFPSENAENGKQLHLQDVPRVFVGKAQAACVPGVQSGLFGAWYWDSPLQSPGGGAAATEASGLPYYLLEALGQISTENENYTLKFWRTDLKKASDSMKVGATRMSATQRAPTQPWWDGGKASMPRPPKPTSLPPQAPSSPPSPMQPPSPTQPPSSSRQVSAPADASVAQKSLPVVAPGCVDQRRSDGVGDNTSGTQQIVIVSGGEALPHPLLAKTPLQSEVSKASYQRDWLLIGLAIAGVSLLVLLLLFALRQSSDKYAFIPDTDI